MTQFISCARPPTIVRCDGRALRRVQFLLPDHHHRPMSNGLMLFSLLLFLCVLLGRDRGKHSQFSVATSKRYAFLGAERCSHLRVSSPGIVNIIMPGKPFCLDAANVCAVCVSVFLSPFTWAHLNVLLIYVISQLGSCITLDRYRMILVMSPGLRQMEL